MNHKSNNVKTLKTKTNYDNIPHALRQLADRIDHGNLDLDIHSVQIIIVDKNFEDYEYLNVGGKMPLMMEVGSLTQVSIQLAADGLAEQLDD
jgi:hypothetical protein